MTNAHAVLLANQLRNLATEIKRTSGGGRGERGPRFTIRERQNWPRAIEEVADFLDGADLSARAVDDPD